MIRQTEVSGSDVSVTIDRSKSITVIGERINPTRGSDLATNFLEGDFDQARELAKTQVANGADLIDVNVDADGVDHVELLPEAVRAVADAVDTPIVIDIHYDRVEALEAAVRACPGKPIINSVTGEEPALASVLPIVEEYDTAVIGLTMGESGVPKDPERRLEIAKTIIEAASNRGIPPEDVIIDPATVPVGADWQGPMRTLKAVDLVTRELGNNITLGVSNVSYGMPQRKNINSVFLAMAIQAGVNVPIVDPSRVRNTIVIADMLAGRDDHAQRYLAHFRREQDN